MPGNTVPGCFTECPDGQIDLAYLLPTSVSSLAVLAWQLAVELAASAPGCQEPNLTEKPTWYSVPCHQTGLANKTMDIGTSNRDAFLFCTIFGSFTLIKLTKCVQP